MVDGGYVIIIAFFVLVTLAGISYSYYKKYAAGNADVEVTATTFFVVDDDQYLPGEEVSMATLSIEVDDNREENGRAIPDSELSLPQATRNFRLIVAESCIPF